MSLELDSNFQSLRISSAQACCAPKYRLKWLKSKGAILIVMWSFLVGSVFHLLRAGYKLKTNDSASEVGIILVGAFLLYPIGGWLADVRMGRYAVIKYSMWIMWICGVLLTLSEVLATLVDAYSDHYNVRLWIFRALLIIMAIALGGFQSNIIQLGIDQLSDATASEITSFLTWYTMTFFTSSLYLHYSSDCIEIKYGILYVKTFLVTLCLTIAICFDILFDKWLIKEQVLGMPLTTILNIIKYIIRNRKLKFMFTNVRESLSDFDVAKQRYGGPFTAQQVENVRTFIWMIVVIATCTFICGVNFPLNYFEDNNMKHAINYTEEGESISRCLEKLSIYYFGYIEVVVLMLFYEFLIHPLFSRCLPKVSIAIMFVLGTVLTLIWILSLLIKDIVLYEKGLYLHRCLFTETEKLNISYKWFLLPKVIRGLAPLFLILSSFEMIWSQAPSTMKGMMFGFGYMFLGLSVLLHTAIAFPFILSVTVPWERVKLTCGIWYILLEAMMTLVALIIITIVFRAYKKRNRQDY